MTSFSTIEAKRRTGPGGVEKYLDGRGLSKEVAEDIFSHRVGAVFGEVAAQLTFEHPDVKYRVRVGRDFTGPPENYVLLESKKRGGRGNWALLKNLGWKEEAKVRVHHHGVGERKLAYIHVRDNEVSSILRNLHDEFYGEFPCNFFIEEGRSR